MINTAISVSGHYLTVLNVLMMVVAAGVLGFAMVSLIEEHQNIIREIINT